MQELQAELKLVKERWTKEIELSKAEKGASTYPFPVTVTRYTPQPESANMWDFDELPVRLVIRDADVAALAVSVEIPPILPGELPKTIEKAVCDQWKKLLSKKKGKDEIWMIANILSWVEEKFGDLLRLVPSYVDSYIGCDDMGASMRRYTLIGPAVEEEEDEEEAEDDEDEEERVREYIERERARIEAEIEEKYQEDEEKRRLAKEGIFVDGEKAKILSKAEKAELNKTRKERSGVRWRKTGAKAHKPEKSEEDKKKEAKKK
eukprot:TRINITY_DN50768_c0_g1_i1.p1 TRINITY_DN50768_c0_g1~~TRINITY_DN50768_c0_g1_i1.p1  ORF type:complete len:296 (+),score=99.42 TRINITY_DN50768_c0_g1_i1:101-889(+)